MPTSSSARRIAEQAAQHSGPSSEPIPLPAATADRYPQPTPTEPEEGFPRGEGLASPLEVCEAQIRELVHHQQEALYAHAELEARVARLEAEVVHHRETERKANDAMIKCLALEARLAESTTLAHQSPSVGQDGPSTRTVPVTVTPPSTSRGDKKTKTRKGKRRNKSQEPDSSDISSVGIPSDSDDSTPSRVSFPCKGAASPGLKELVPARSDFRALVSYRTYRLENPSQRFDGAVTRRLASYVKGLRHSLEDKFTGVEPIEILHFLRTFKEAADHLDVSEGAASRLLPYFLDGVAREGYKAHLDEVPVGVDVYPYMVQYLLETYARDDALSQAYMAVTTAKMADGETEQAFGHRLYRAAIRAGNVVSKTDLKTIFLEGLPPFIQAGMRLHVTPSMSFEKVQQLAHDLGSSLRQTALQAASPPSKGKLVAGVKPVATRVTRPGAVNVVRTEDSGSDDGLELEKEKEMREVPLTRRDLEVAVATIRAQGSPLNSTTFTGRSTWPGTPPPRSPAASVVSIPTRGWASPGGSSVAFPVREMPNPPPRGGVTRPPLCFMCYTHGHYLSGCPRLPADLRWQAQGNREAYQRRQATLPPMAGVPPPPNGRQAAVAALAELEVPPDPSYAMPEPTTTSLLSGGRTAWPHGVELAAELDEVAECQSEDRPLSGSSGSGQGNAPGGN